MILLATRKTLKQYFLIIVTKQVKIPKSNFFSKYKRLKKDARVSAPNLDRAIFLVFPAAIYHKALPFNAILPQTRFQSPLLLPNSGFPSAFAKVPSETQGFQLFSQESFNNSPRNPRFNHEFHRLSMPFAKRHVFEEGFLRE